MTMWGRASWVAVASILAAGCTPTVQLKGTDASRVRYVSEEHPHIGKRRSATVGEALYWQERRVAHTGVRLERQVDETFGLGARVHLPADAVLLPADVTGEGDAYCSKQAAYTEPLAANPSRPVCFFDENQDGRLDRYWVAGTLASTARELPETPVYEGTQKLGKDGFRRELLYQGTQDGVIRLKYREFNGTIARPAFSQDLTYTVDGLPTTIRFQSVAIAVEDVGGSEIRYSVESGF